MHQSYFLFIFTDIPIHISLFVVQQLEIPWCISQAAAGIKEHGYPKVLIVGASHGTHWETYAKSQDQPRWQHKIGNSQICRCWWSHTRQHGELHPRHQSANIESVNLEIVEGTNRYWIYPRFHPFHHWLQHCRWDWLPCQKDAPL